MSNNDLTEEELREMTQKGTRTQRAAEDAEKESEAFANILHEQLDAIEDGETNPTISFRDADLDAFLTALDETEEMDDVVNALRDELGSSGDGARRSDVLRLSLRFALRTVAEEEFETLRDVKRDRIEV